MKQTVDGVRGLIKCYLALNTSRPVYDSLKDRFDSLSDEKIGELWVLVERAQSCSNEVIKFIKGV